MTNYMTIEVFSKNRERDMSAGNLLFHSFHEKNSPPIFRQPSNSLYRSVALGHSPVVSGPPLPEHITIYDLTHRRARALLGICLGLKEYYRFITI